MSKRLFCVDLLRGIDIFYLLAFSYIFLWGGYFQVWKDVGPTARILWDHAQTAFVAADGHVPTGFGIQDFAQPLFIFVTGVSASLAMRKFIRPDGIDLKGFWKRLLQRTLMLWTLGCLIRGVLQFKLFLGEPSFVFYCDTLHTIAVAYFGASVGLLIRKRWVRLVLALSLIAAIGIVQATCGDYTRLGNASRVFEDWVYGKIGGKAKDFCYLLTTFTWMGMGILASLAGDVLKSETLRPWSKARIIGLSGIVMFLVGWALTPWVPAIRFIYTASLVLESQGIALVMLAALFVLTDIYNFRKGMGLLIMFGQCSLAAWMMVNFFGSSLYYAAELFVKGIPKLIGTAEYQPLFNSIVRVVILIWAVHAWQCLRAYKTQVKKAKAQQ